MIPVVINRKSLALGVLLSLGVLFAACKATPARATLMENHARAGKAVLAAEDNLIAFRHDLHRHPEIPLREKRTSGKIVEELNALGFEVHENVGGYGVVALLRGTDTIHSDS